MWARTIRARGRSFAVFTRGHILRLVIYCEFVGSSGRARDKNEAGYFEEPAATGESWSSGTQDGEDEDLGGVGE